MPRSQRSPFCPLQFFMFPPFRLLSPVTFCLPRNFPYPHTPRLAYPVQSCCAVGGHSHSAQHPQGRQRFSNASPIRECQSGIYKHGAALAMQTLRARKGAARKDVPPGSQARITAVRFLSAHRCGERSMVRLARSCPHTCDVVQHLQLPVPLWPWLHKCCMCSLCLSTITARLIANLHGSYPRRDRGAAVLSSTVAPKRSATQPRRVLV